MASASEDESGSVAIEDEEAGGSEPFTHGEWNATHSILNFEDVMAHYEPMMFKENVSQNLVLGLVMSSPEASFHW